MVVLTENVPWFLWGHKQWELMGFKVSLQGEIIRNLYVLFYQGAHGGCAV